MEKPVPSPSPRLGDTMAAADSPVPVPRATFVFGEEGGARPGEPAPAILGEGGRFVLRRSIGLGGMGEVFCAWDTVLHREVALKVGHADLMRNLDIRDRFIEEARTQARLQHPNLVPVHDLGLMEDGRPWFTMDIIRGESFHDVVARVHAASTDGWSASTDGWSLHRLVSVLVQAARAVGFAHELGVVHRDIKPRNLMVGSFGEVRVVDWGIASVQSSDGARRAGRGLSGTPNYMSPEQATEDADGVDARTDVYALGAVLYEILAGRAPYADGDHDDGASGASRILRKVRAGPPPRVTEVARLPVPAELVDVLESAMARDVAHRCPDAKTLAAAMEAWLEGSRNRAVARSIVLDAELTRSVAAEHRAAAAALRGAARRALDAVPSYAPAAQKAEAWSMEDRAEELEREADLVDARRVQAYRAALSHAPDSVEAHAALVLHHRAQLVANESALRSAAAAIAGLHLRRHLEALPAGHPERLEGLPWLEGDGTLTLSTVPPDAAVHLERMVVRNRRLEPELVRSLGVGPLATTALPMGSYRLRVEAAGHAPAVYPFAIARAEPWSAAAPGGGAVPLRLLPAAELDADDVYIPAGWFRAGGDPRAPGTPLTARRIWVEDFVVQRFPVTHRAYIAFLHDLVADGREAEALEHAPRLMGASPGEAGALVYAYADGAFALRPESDGAFWSLDAPVVLVTAYGAQAYAAWYAARTGKPWRLVDEMEREKAARGVDGRLYPWGDHFDPSWTTMRDSHAGKPRSAEVRACAEDESVYGVRGVAGNVLDWTCSAYVPAGATADGEAHAVVVTEGAGRRVARGGSWNDAASSARCATRYNIDATIRLNFVSFRLARSLP